MDIKKVLKTKLENNTPNENTNTDVYGVNIPTVGSAKFAGSVLAIKP